MKDTLIIIPAYNEEKAIGKVLDNILGSKAGDFADILVINDKSRDGTARVVAGYGKPVILLNHVYNMGYGAALKTGYAYATKHGYEYIIQLDADGQHSVENIERLYSKIKSDKEADIVIGSRFVEGSTSFPISFAKKLAISFFRWLIKFHTKCNITDPTSGLQAIKRRAFSYYTGYMNFDPRYPDANMIIKMIMLNFKVVEIDSVMYERENGESMHSGFEPILYMIHMILSTITVILQSKLNKPGKEEFI